MLLDHKNMCSFKRFKFLQIPIQSRSKKNLFLRFYLLYLEVRCTIGNLNVNSRTDYSRTGYANCNSFITAVRYWIFASIPTNTTQQCLRNQFNPIDVFFVHYFCDSNTVGRFGFSTKSIIFRRLTSRCS